MAQISIYGGRTIHYYNEILASLEKTSQSLPLHSRPWKTSQKKEPEPKPKPVNYPYACIYMYKLRFSGCVGVGNLIFLLTIA